MPGPLIAFWVLIGLGSTSALWGPPHAWSGVDPTARTSGKIEPTFMTRLSAPAYQYAQRNIYGVEECIATVIAVTPRQRVTRVQIDGQEQLLDWSWSVDVRALPNQRRNVVVRYLDPQGGEQLACHTVSFACVPESWDGAIRTVKGGTCE